MSGHLADPVTRPATITDHAFVPDRQGQWQTGRCDRCGEAETAHGPLLPGSEDRCECCCRVLDCCGNCNHCEKPRRAGMSETTTLYIAGPMSGYAGHNYPAFDKAERDLTLAGYTALNPATNPPCDRWEGYMRAAIGQVIQADGLAVLDGWQMSAGAALEVHIAHALRLPVHDLAHWLERAFAAGLSR